MAGEEGFEPSNGGSKGRCLTTWRLPSNNRFKIVQRLNAGENTGLPRAWQAQIPFVTRLGQLQSLAVLATV